MDIKEILSKCDHTLLAVDSTWDQIKQVCDDGIKYGCASVCIPPSFVKRAKEYVGDRLTICTVIGFPNGYSTTDTKLYEAANAIDNGADEIDMVVNIGMVKEGDRKGLLEEIFLMAQACHEEDAILKVIIETCLLTEEEKVMMCQVVSEAGADFIKTSTGFSKAGATHDDVKLMKANVAGGVKVKAAGGIADLADAALYIEEGADRLGTSRIVKAAKALQNPKTQGGVI